jgi:flagellar biosynthesis protein FlhG
MSDQAQKLRDMVARETGVAPSSENGDEAPDPETRAEVITVTSGKGGVGKSDLAVNLGIALSDSGYDVAVADMDLGLANVNVITGSKPDYNLLDVLKGRREIEDVLQDAPGGISILAGASGEEELANLSSEGCRNFVNQLAELDRLVDVLIVDTSAGLSERVMQFVNAADRTILVTTPEPTAITDAYAIVKSALGDPPRPSMNLVINRADSIMEGKNVAEKMKRVGEQFLDAPIRVLGYMTEDDAVMKAVRQRRPFYLEFPEARVSQCVSHIESRLMDGQELQEPAGVGSFFSKLTGWWG